MAAGLGIRGEEGVDSPARPAWVEKGEKGPGDGGGTFGGTPGCGGPVGGGAGVTGGRGAGGGCFGGPGGDGGITPLLVPVIVPSMKVPVLGPGKRVPVSDDAVRGPLASSPGLGKTTGFAFNTAATPLGRAPSSTGFSVLKNSSALCRARISAEVKPSSARRRRGSLRSACNTPSLRAALLSSWATRLKAICLPALAIQLSGRELLLPSLSDSCPGKSASARRHHHSAHSLL